VEDFLSAHSQCRPTLVGLRVDIQLGGIDLSDNLLSAPLTLAPLVETLESLSDIDPNDIHPWINIMVHGHAGVNRRLSKALMYPGLKIRSESARRQHNAFRATVRGKVLPLAHQYGV